MIVLNNDVVKLKSGDIGTVIDTWGVARHWCKVKTDEGTIYVMTDQVESIIERKNTSKRRKWR